MKVKIITDGNNILGLGHIYQSVTLAFYLSHLKTHNIEIEFITKSDESIAKLITDSGFNVSRFLSDEEIFSYLMKEKADRIIFDKLDVSPTLAKKIKINLKTKLIIFSNLTSANIYADISVIADYGSNFNNIVKKDKQTGRTSYNGPKYWILRPDFYETKKSGNKVNDIIENILLIFGGSDPSNYSTFVLEELISFNKKFKVNVVLGKGFNHNKEFNSVVDNCKSNSVEVTVLRNVSNIAQLMQKSDLVFASPGLSLFEALSLGKSVLCFHQNDEQMKAYKGYITTYGISGINKIRQLLENREFLSPALPIIKNMEIGMGKDELINEIIN